MCWAGDYWAKKTKSTTRQMVNHRARLVGPNGQKILWRVRDSNPRRQCQLIYSQIPLAAWVTRHALPTNVFTNRVRVTTIVHGGQC